MVLYVTKNRGKLLIFGKVGCLWQCVVRMFLQPFSPLNGKATDWIRRLFPSSLTEMNLRPFDRTKTSRHIR